MSEITIYDKGRGRLDPLTCAVSQLWRETQRTGEGWRMVGENEKRKPDLLAQDFVVAHILEDDWDYLLERSPSGSVRIRVSTLGVEGMKGVKPADKTPQGVFVFYLRTQTSEMYESDWLHVLRGILDPKTGQPNLDKCEKLFSGQDPDDLKKHIVWAELLIFEVLPALSLLCQAYIAQLAETNGKDEPQPPRTKADVEALSIAGLGEWPQEVEPAEGQDYRPYEPQWWRVFDKDFKTEAVREWKSLTKAADEDDDWSLVEKLLNAIDGDAPITTEMVAESYAAIVRRCGQQQET